MRPWQGGGGSQPLSGTVVVTTTASATGSAVVTFPAGYFSAAPKIALGCSNTFYLPTFTSRSATSVTVVVTHRSDAVASGTVSVDWIAIQ